MSDEDIFAGDVEGRLERIDRRVTAVVRDAQFRDWIAERPGRESFAWLGQVHHELRSAIRGYNPYTKPDNWLWPLLGIASWFGTAALVLLVADHPAAPLTLASAVVAGAVADVASVAIYRRVRRVAEPPGIDDPFLYADLTRRIEACAATARAGSRDSDRAAAAGLGRALDWVSTTRDEITRGSSPAAR